MAVVIHAIQRTRLYEEPNGSFAVDHSGTLGDFIDVPVIEGSASLTLNKEMLASNIMQSNPYGYQLEIVGKASAELKFKVHLAPTGVASSASVSSVQGALGRLLKILMGGESLAQGSAATGTPTSTSIIVTAGQGSRFTAGTAIAAPTGTSGALEARALKSVSTDTLAPKTAFSAAPVATDVIRRSATYYLTDTLDTSAQVVVEGLEPDDRWLLRGGQGSFTISMAPGALPEVEVTLNFAAWSNLGSGSIASPSYTNRFEVALLDNCLQVPTAGSTVANPLHASAVEFAPNLTVVPLTSTCGTNTVAQWVRARSAPAMKGSFTIPYEDLTWFTGRDNQTLYNMFLQVGNVAGKIALVEMPTAQVNNVQRIADGNGIAAQKVDLVAQNDSDATDATTAIRRSSFRIHLL